MLETLQEPLSAPDQQLKQSTMAQVGVARVGVAQGGKVYFEMGVSMAGGHYFCSIQSSCQEFKPRFYLPGTVTVWGPVDIMQFSGLYKVCVLT